MIYISITSYIIKQRKKFMLLAFSFVCIGIENMKYLHFKFSEIIVVYFNKFINFLCNE